MKFHKFSWNSLVPLLINKHPQRILNNSLRIQENHEIRFQWTFTKINKWQQLAPTGFNNFTLLYWLVYMHAVKWRRHCRGIFLPWGTELCYLLCTQSCKINNKILCNGLRAWKLHHGFHQAPFQKKKSF